MTALDTDGTVTAMCSIGGGPIYFQAVHWSDLDPFTQGYGEAAALELYERLPALAHGRTAAEAVAFRNWSPEALALILNACETAAKITREAMPGVDLSHVDGRRLWEHQQREFPGPSPYDSALRRSLPPLAIYLYDEGKVCLAVAS